MKISKTTCFSLTITIFIYTQLVTETNGHLKKNYPYSSKEQNLIEYVGQHLLLGYPREDSSAGKKANFSRPCIEHIYHFVMGILKPERGDQWILKMIDASSKLPSGILEGHIIDFGMYDECVGIKVQKNDTEIRGRHCMSQISVGLNDTIIGLKLGMCIPATCNAMDLNHMLNLVLFNITNFGDNYGIRILSSSCSNPESPEWTPGSITTLVVLGSFVGFLLLCTILDLILPKMTIKNSLLQNLTNLSMYKSALQILSTRVNPASFPVLNGIRVLSIFWIVMGHSYQNKGYTYVQVNNLDLFNWITSWKSIYATISIFAVDSFFTLSGFLMGYLFLKEMSKGRKFNLLDYYLHRYIRLTPAVLVLVLIAMFIVPHLGSGPIWEDGLAISNNCEGNWWPFLVYLQNYFGARIESQCLGHLWYLAVDMQLFLISPIILYPLAKKRNLGLAILGFAFIASIVVPAAIIVIKKFPAHLVGADDDQMEEVYSQFYIVPYVRGGPWIVGIFFGFITATKSVKLNRVNNILGWLIAASCFIFCTLGYESLIRKDYEYNMAWEAVNGSLTRIMWAIGVSWIIFATNNGYGGPVGKILSLPIFLPFSRISYCLYLVHMLMQMVTSYSIRTNHYFSDFEFFKTFLTDLVMASVIAFFFSLFFESPILILEKMIFQKEKKAKTENTELNSGQRSKA